jgi:hypothetical protein
MQEYFEIHPSALQLRLLLGAHLLLALVLAVYVEPPAFKLCAVSLVVLLGWREFNLGAAQDSLVLHYDPRAALIAVQQGKQPYFYSKYKVYGTRWFAILKFDDKHENRTLILNSERFDSEQSYRRLRYLLARTERSGVD